jgi:hypothetical protein
MYYDLSDDSSKPTPPPIPNWVAWLIVIVLLSALWECCHV